MLAWFIVCLLGLTLQVSTTYAQSHPITTPPAHRATLPASLAAFLEVQHLVPMMQGPDAAGVLRPYGGLNLCKLVARRDERQPFAPLPRDYGGEETCDLTNVVAAWHLWCDAGVLDAAGGVHFSQCHFPVITIHQYGPWTVIRCQNYAKLNAHGSEADERAAEAFFLKVREEGWPADADIRSAETPVLPWDWVTAGLWPPQKKQ